ncbi:alanine dehydrogenase [Arthrobacter crystallopoietes]|uniref:Alanine dehydrogenase n=1 Tax=Crystallibacter crystallopoietes TaxID=37928 RepID=A0A1H1H5D9_9MICC|nr:alanine dehydrogenase [Arthrobacter crystallopoietes]AUI52145.1 alanine dehydrogenase [Arthrobacter crystallopoietes]SDR20573.1 L-alanine dehydrogenase [Arthrobacter crystallopoietes]
MRVGVPREVKNNEFRVAITPSGVHELTLAGHEVLVETGAGNGSSITNEDYAAAGATVLGSADETWARAEMVLKVKEPVAEEYHRLREDLILFTYLHLAADAPLTKELCERGVTAVAYETVQLPDRSLPLLAPMSEVAGRLAPQVGAYTLMKSQSGRGILLGGIPGTHAANVVVIGAGVAGSNAVSIAVGMRANVTVLDTNVRRLQELDDLYQGRVNTIVSNALELDAAVSDADMVIGAVLVPGAKAPKLVSNELVSRMRSGAVLVDISIDQGGCFEDSRPTTHAYPTYPVHDTMFYCVANMPGAVPRTSTYALTNATLPYVKAITQDGLDAAARRLPELLPGINTRDGRIVSEPVRLAHPQLA